MPPSQLKQLKASLRVEGIIGPSQSKSKKKKDRGSGVTQERRNRQAAALYSIREQFNPFENQLPSRAKSKYDITTGKTTGAKASNDVVGRPGVTKGFGEERRRGTLLKEMHQRNKVGGIVDRRFGENDPTMDPEERMLQRFTKEKQRRLKNGAVFNLEDDYEEGELTHFGKALSLGNDRIDGKNDSGSDHSPSESNTNSRKRKRLFGLDSGDDDEQPGTDDRPKSRKDILHEVISKSKLHKYERQQAKEEDEDEREALDKELPQLLAIMKGRQVISNTEAPPKDPNEQPSSGTKAGSSDLLSKNQAYDKQLREMALDRRSRPTDKTKTEEEKAQEEASRLHSMNADRLRRMQRYADESDDGEPAREYPPTRQTEEAEMDDARRFGLGSGVSGSTRRPEMDVEDEDDFVLDSGLIASDSADEVSNDMDSLLDDSLSEADSDGDAEFIGELTVDEGDRQGLLALGAPAARCSTRQYACPQTHEELMEAVGDVSADDLPAFVRRIRFLYSPELESGNKEKLGVFASLLVKHVAFLADQPVHPPLAAVEQLIRHVHSLAKAYPIEVGNAFRDRLLCLHEERPTSPKPGDLIILTAVVAIFPTSDHFHQVVTPAMMSMGRYLSQTRPENVSDLATGALIGSLCLQYQSLAKRYIPELVNYILNAVRALAPAGLDIPANSAPLFDLPASLRIQARCSQQSRRLHFWDVLPQDLSESEEQLLKMSVLETFTVLVDHMAKLWVSHPAFVDALGPVLQALRRLRESSHKMLAPLATKISSVVENVEASVDEARRLRRPLALHYHRPLAIKTSIPKFEESYDPKKHYDPNRERQEFNKLKAEHKREKKAVLRELRKDANFIARERLRQKKEQDAEYEKKYKRLVAEIQGEEAHEAKAYEREKQLRKRQR